MLLFDVVLICFKIRYIVNDINSAGDQAEQDRSGQRVKKGALVQQLPVKDQGGKNEYALDPLFRAHRFNQGCNHNEIIARFRGGW